MAEKPLTKEQIELRQSVFDLEDNISELCKKRDAIVRKINSAYIQLGRLEQQWSDSFNDGIIEVTNKLQEMSDEAGQLARAKNMPFYSGQENAFSRACEEIESVLKDQNKETNEPIHTEN